MSRIHILPPQLADKIAAGEVVERPASVVKELIENSLDAKATYIRLDVKKAGKELIQVSDNGCGMTRAETELSIQRHATSKLQTEEDLFQITTLGFRGEALPSMASVSHLILETKFNGENILEGTCLEVKGGEVLPPRAAGCPFGTMVQIKNLFYNTPARLKFLKSDGVELGHVEDIFVRLALSHFECGFDFYNEGVLKKSYSLAQDPLQRLQDCLGNSFSQDLIEVHEENPQIQLKGWVLHPRQTTSNANDIYFFLNNRFLKDKVLHHAIMQGFEDFLMKGRFPKSVLYLKMQPDAFDVNVHPTKREVRFVNSQAVHQFVAMAVKKALQGEIYGSSVRVNKCSSVQVEQQDLNTCGLKDLNTHDRADRVQHAVERFYGSEPVIKAKPKRSIHPWETQEQVPFSFEASPILTTPVFKSLRVIGALANTYIICEGADHQLILIDQHAAHEKIGFEKLKANLGSKECSSQRLLIPLTWEATPKQAAFLKTHLEVLQQAGLEIEPFGGESFVIKSIPVLLAESQIPDLLSHLVEELEDLDLSTVLQTKLDHVLKTFACHLQVRAHDKLSLEEMQHLLAEMEESHATHCPHGRPTFVEISLSQIEKWFKRS